jgi:acyl-CoA hydrolase
METYRLVLPGDLNHYGFLFGGNLLCWVDEASWIAASLDYPKSQFVTIAMETVEFHHSVREGTILEFQCVKVRKGNTSVTYDVKVRDRKAHTEPIFSTRVTFVAVDKDGGKVPIEE